MYIYIYIYVYIYICMQKHIHIYTPDIYIYIYIIKCVICVYQNPRLNTTVNENKKYQCHIPMPRWVSQCRDQAWWWMLRMKPRIFLGYKKRNYKPLLVGGWATPLKNMNVSWDD